MAGLYKLSAKPTPYFTGGESRTGGAEPPTRTNKRTVMLIAYIASNNSYNGGSLFFHLGATSRNLEKELDLNEAQTKGPERMCPAPFLFPPRPAPRPAMLERESGLEKSSGNQPEVGG